MSSVYKNLRVENGNISVETARVTQTHTVVSALAVEGEISNEEYLELLRTTENKVLDMGDTFRIIRNTEESDMGNKISRAMEAITKQYAPDEDTAWVWMRKANDAGWTWGMHGHRVPGAQTSTPIVGFSNGDGVYVGITLFAGKVWWSWFTGEEWGPSGRDLCLSGHRARHETPIAAIAEYELSQGCNGELDYEIHDVGQLKDANS
jgi:hypothetical protein